MKRCKALEWEVWCDGKRKDGLGCTRFHLVWGIAAQVVNKKWKCFQHRRKREGK